MVRTFLRKFYDFLATYYMIIHIILYEAWLDMQGILDIFRFYLHTDKDFKVIVARKQRKLIQALSIYIYIS